MDTSHLDRQMLDAVVNNDLAAVEKFVSQGANINFIDRWGNCAMFTAVADIR